MTLRTVRVPARCAPHAGAPADVGARRSIARAPLLAMTTERG